MSNFKNAFTRARQDHARELAEDYLEVIYQIGLAKGGVFDFVCGTFTTVKTAEITRVMEVSQPTVTKSLDRLQKSGYVCVHQRQHVHLTEAGYEIGKASYERHYLVVAFLESLGISKYQAELDAEGIEHHVSDETLQAMRAKLEEAAHKLS